MNPFKIILVGLILRICNAFYNAFVEPSFGATGDAGAFAQAAEILIDDSSAAFALGWGRFYDIPYTLVVMAVYRATGSNVFLPGVLNAFFWFFSAICFIKSVALVTQSKQKNIQASLVFSLMPSTILFTSVTLRESLEIFSLAVPAYLILDAYLKDSNGLRNLALSMPFLYIGWQMHSGLVAYTSLFFMAAYAFLETRKKSSIPIIKYSIMIGLILTVSAIGFAEYSKTNYSIAKNSEVSVDEDGIPVIDTEALADGLGESVEKYQSILVGKDARTNYAETAEIDGALDLILHIPVLVTGYMLAPWPWQMSSPLDILVFIENWLRAYLIFLAVKNFRQKSGSAEIKIGRFFFLMWALLEFAWAMGTTNWGTAVRHHIVGLHMLLIAAVAGASDEKRRALRIRWS
jgi:hypothetical protein